ncbi:relaxase/mobilization nuclease domain-containing protein [Pantoea agglomerans]|uniref:relaxase/mobilization nuclease domain-containing protein n=1 Tax=Enterobacter agglomerans TaxID=549 RepID=UPI001F074C99|nr:relaxase/mobilization nuclease domain-containing protein [Pantoea agglomerans]MCH9407187.1 relaxase/mobilization nuclease domain-containing protein [Pantoea agglomerans]WNK31855.1 relaxase/mobilization nuclease domain-containing protein [Pantoea agglomerans]WNK63667.1 relaxase/mobilization nuclease domain-containing protein [Pantoea agglomerans]
MQKIKRGKSFAGVVLYALKPGTHHKTDPVVIGGNMLGASATELISEFSASASLRTDILKPVWHNSLRLPQGDSLTEEQWATFADDYMTCMGFSDTHLRCYVLHDDEAGQHIHIIASRVDLVGGKLYLGRNENLANTRIIQELELAYDLTRTKGPSPSHVPYPASKRKKLSRNEQQKEKREGQPTPKTFLQNTIDELLTSAISILGFVEALTENGITTIPNISSTGRMNGFSFEYSGIAFKASQLGKSYSWANLQEKLRYEPERDNPLLFALKASSIGDNEKSDLVTETTKEDTRLSLNAAMVKDVITRPPEHEQRVVATETYEADIPASTVLTVMESASNKDYLMTAVMKWLMSIPYLVAFAKLLKGTGKTFLHRKSSFSVINAVSSAEPDVKTSNEVTEYFIKSSYTPY